MTDVVPPIIIDTTRPSHAMPLLRFWRMLGYVNVKCPSGAPSWLPGWCRVSDGESDIGDFRYHTAVPFASWDAYQPAIMVIPREFAWNPKFAIGALYHPDFGDVAPDTGHRFESAGCSIGYDAPSVAAGLPHFTGAAALPEEQYLARLLRSHQIVLSAGIVHCTLAFNCLPHRVITLFSYGNDQRDNLLHVTALLRHAHIPYDNSDYNHMPAVTFIGPTEPLLPVVSKAVINQFQQFLTRRYHDTCN